MEDGRQRHRHKWWRRKMSTFLLLLLICSHGTRTNQNFQVHAFVGTGTICVSTSTFTSTSTASTTQTNSIIKLYSTLFFDDNDGIEEEDIIMDDDDELDIRYQGRHKLLTMLHHHTTPTATSTTSSSTSKPKKAFKSKKKYDAVSVINDDENDDGITEDPMEKLFWGGDNDDDDDEENNEEDEIKCEDLTTTTTTTTKTTEISEQEYQEQQKVYKQWKEQKELIYQSSIQKRKQKRKQAQQKRIDERAKLLALRALRLQSQSILPSSASVAAMVSKHANSDDSDSNALNEEWKREQMIRIKKVKPPIPTLSLSSTWNYKRRSEEDLEDDVSNYRENTSSSTSSFPSRQPMSSSTTSTASSSSTTQSQRVRTRAIRTVRTTRLEKDLEEKLYGERFKLGWKVYARLLETLDELRQESRLIANEFITRRVEEQLMDKAELLTAATVDGGEEDVGQQVQEKKEQNYLKTIEQMNQIQRLRMQRISKLSLYVEDSSILLPGVDNQKHINNSNEKEFTSFPPSGDAIIDIQTSMEEALSLDEKLDTIETEDLVRIFKIRGNVRRRGPIPKKRLKVLQLLYESFTNKLF